MALTDVINNPVFGLLLDVLGFSSWDDTSPQAQQLRKLRSELTAAANSLVQGYKAYAAEVAEIIPEKETAVLQKAVDAASDRRSEFYQYINRFPAFSRAKKVVNTAYTKLQKAEDEARSKLTEAEAANEAIRAKNEKITAEVAKRNEQASKAVQQANSAIDAKLTAINNTINQIDTLDSASSSGRRTDAWKRAAYETIDAANKLVNQPTN